MKAVVWNGEQLGAAFEDREIPEDLLELAEEYRSDYETLYPPVPVRFGTYFSRTICL